MAERKWAMLWVMGFVAVAAIFSGGGAWADPSASATCSVFINMPAGQCVNLNGYDVRVAKGLFPRYLENGNSVFKWAIVPVAATQNLNLVNIKIPAAIGRYRDLNSTGPNGIRVSIVKPPGIHPLSDDSWNNDDDDNDDRYCPVNCSNLPRTGGGTDPGWYLYDAGKGDPTTTLGKGEFDYYVLRVIPPGSCPITKTSGAKIRVVFKNRQLFASLDTFLVKAGNDTAGLNLLGPSLASQSTSPADAPAVRSGESFVLGATGCRMDVTLNSDFSIAKAVVVPVDPNNPAPCGDGTPLPIVKISTGWLCDQDGSGNPIHCRQKRSAEQNIAEFDSGSCTYKYTTKTGQTVTKIIPDPCTTP